MKIFTENYGNPSALHSMGIKAEKIVNESRKIISGILCIKPDEVVFTSGGTESNNMAIIGVAHAYSRSGMHVITLKSEHPSVLVCFEHLKEQGFDVEYADDAVGLVDMVKDDTTLVSFMHINNETGLINNIEKTAELIKKKNPNTKLHVDAVQSFGKFDINMKNIDLLSLSAHKIHGIKGVGALCIKNGVKINPLLHGGGQQKNMRPGTEDTAGIASLMLAAQLMYDNLEKNYHHMTELKQSLMEIRKLGGVRFISDNNGSPYILNLSFDDVKAEVLLHALAERDIYVSTGSACSSRIKKRPGTNESIRFSFCPDNTVEEIEECINVLNEIVPMLRRIK